MSAPTATTAPASQSTEQLVSQLALSATWLHLDGRRPGPIQAALEVLEVQPDDALVAEVAGAVRAATGLDWTEQVAYILHLLLTTEDGTALLAA
ncbi:MAG TPA: hypothetical protein VMM13_09920 [Euzebya sp.]|nr:hypothetical protein [Euzebya sp.]